MRLIHFRPKKRHARKAVSKRRKAPRRYRRNPGGAMLKSALSPSNFIQIASVTVGFVGGAKLGGMIYDKAFSTGALAKLRRFAGLVTFALGAIGASKVKNPMVQKAMAGVSAAGVYDLIAQNLPAAGLKPVSGENIDMSGVDLVGDGENSSVYAGESIDVSGDMTELVGDESESIYG